MLGELKENIEEFHSFFELAPLGYHLLDENGCILNINKAWIDFFGYSKEQVLGKWFGDFLLPKSQEKLKSKFSDFKKKGEVSGIEYEVVKSNGDHAIISFDGRISRDENGKFKQAYCIFHDITSQKQLERKLIELREQYKNLNNEFEHLVLKKTTNLKESEEKFRKMFTDSPIGIESFDLNGKLNDLNQACMNIFGILDINQVREFDLLGDPNIPKDVMEKLEKGKTVRYKLIFDFELVKELNLYDTSKSGKIYIYVLITPIFNETTKLISSYLVQVQDITEEKEIEEKLKILKNELEQRVEDRTIELKESEDKYKELFNNMSSGVAVYEAVNEGDDFIFIDFNFSGEKIDNIKKEDVVGNSVLKIFPRVKEFGLLDVFQRVWKTGIPENHPITLYKDDRISGWRENYVYKLSSGEIVAVYDDITERKKAEQEMRLNGEIMINLAEGIYIIRTSDLKIMWANPRFEEMFGYEPGEMIGKVTTIVNAPTDKSPEETAAEIMGVLEKTGEWHGEVNNVKKDGTHFWCYANVSVFEHPEYGEVLVSVYSDITERKEAEELIREENIKLLELNKMKSELINRASHELKTPVISIYGVSQYLLEYYSKISDAKKLSFLNSIYKGGKRLKILIENLIDTSRMESNKVELNLKPKDLIKVINECIHDLDYMAKNRNLIIKFDLTEKLIIEVDKIRIRQVITNLLSNAIKNTPRFGKIHVKAYHSGDNIIIAIEDTGIGLNDDEKKLIFKKFGKIERYGKGFDVDIEGSGLGLYIAAEISKLHGGKIWVESEGRNKGSTFYFSLPLNN